MKIKNKISSPSGEYIVQVSSIMIESYRVKANSYDDAGKVWAKGKNQEPEEIERVDPKLIRIIECQND